MFLASFLTTMNTLRTTLAQCRMFCDLEEGGRPLSISLSHSSHPHPISTINDSKFVSPESVHLQVFGPTAFEAQGKYFRLLHFTSEQSYGDKDQRAVLRFSFRLPPIERMEELTRLISAVGVFVDIVGNYKLTPDQKKRAEKV